MLDKAPWHGRRMSNAELQQQWQERRPHIKPTLGNQSPEARVSASASVDNRIEWHVGQILEHCPIGSRVSINVEPGIFVSCRKESEAPPLVIRWIIND